MSLTSSIEVRIRATLLSVLDLVTATAPLNVSFTDELTSGTIADAADLVFTDTRTLAASATEDLDLAAALTDPFGATLTFAKIKLVYISAASGNTNDVQVTRPASNGVPAFIAAGDGLAIKPGGIMLLFAPKLAGLCTVTAGTGDLLTVTNSAGSTSVTYSIVIIGTSA